MGCFDRFIHSSLRDIKDAKFYKAVVGEMLGVMVLVFVSCTSPYGETAEVGVDFTRISLAFGFSVATLVWILADISGGHINPAVTMGMFVARKVSLVRCLLYIIAQLLGAVLGSAIQQALICDWQRTYKNSLKVNSSSCEIGMTKLSNGLLPIQGFGIEFMITFVLVATVFATCDKNRSDVLRGSGPLAIGLSVSMCHLAFSPLTGVSMNTARSFGPAVIRGQYKNHWVYWCGPILGGVVAGVFYEFFLSGDASVSKLTSCVMDADYLEEREEEREDNSKCKVAEEHEPNEAGPRVALVQEC